MNVVSDLLLFLLPLPMIWQLRLSPREKFGLVLIFMSGIMYASMLYGPNSAEADQPAATAR